MPTESIAPELASTAPLAAKSEVATPVPVMRDSFWSNIQAEDILKYNWGKVQVKPHLTLLSYFTDNFQFRDSALAESDTIFYLSPGVQFLYGNQEFNHLSLDLTHDEVFYINHSNFSTSQDHLRFDGVFSYNRWQLIGSDQYEMLSSFIGIANSQRTILINRQPWTDFYQLTLDATTRLKPYIRGYHSETEYDPGSSFYNSQTLRGTAGTSYILTSRVDLFTEVYYGQDSPSRNSEVQAAPYYNLFMGGVFGARGQFTTRIQGSVRFGYENRSVPNNPVVSDRGSPVVTVDLTYTPTEYCQIKLSASESTGASPTTPSTTVENKVKLSVAQFLTSSLRWSIQLDASATISDISGTIVQDLPVPYPIQTPSGSGIVTLFSDGNSARSDQNFSLGLSLNYIPNRWLKCSVGYGFEEYTPKYSNRAFRLYNDSLLNGLHPYQVNSLTLQMTIGF